MTKYTPYNTIFGGGFPPTKTSKKKKYFKNSFLTRNPSTEYKNITKNLVKNLPKINKLAKDKYPYEDWDKDGLKNKYDCQPLNKYKYGKKEEHIEQIKVLQNRLSDFDTEISDLIQQRLHNENERKKLFDQLAGLKGTSDWQYAESVKDELQENKRILEGLYKQVGEKTSARNLVEADILQIKRKIDKLEDQEYQDASYDKKRKDILYDRDELKSRMSPKLNSFMDALKSGNEQNVTKKGIQAMKIYMKNYEELLKQGYDKKYADAKAKEMTEKQLNEGINTKEKIEKRINKAFEKPTFNRLNKKITDFKLL